jgi:hypothetical protein
MVRRCGNAVAWRQIKLAPKFPAMAGLRRGQATKTDAAGHAASLIDKHAATAIAWWLEQMEQSPDLGGTSGI